ncbi:MAG: XTP/dITP diphosphatase [Sporomusaceae bacterium]|nr:XTP/dITP diphosphatase [Sporomusaceae bacterium]
MAKQEIVVASKNKGKIKEIAEYFSHLPVTVLALDQCGDFGEVAEDGATFLANATKKAVEYAKQTKKFCLADDSGLEVDALQLAPGVYSARYAGEQATDAQNNEKLLHALKGVPEEARTGRFRCSLVLAGPDGEVLLTADGVCEGLILQAPQGSGGFGYDPLFFVPELGKTLSEVSIEEKNQLSHRGLALKEMAHKLAAMFP